MLIRLLSPWKDRKPGDTDDVSGAVADVLVRRGHAEYVVPTNTDRTVRVTVHRDAITETRNSTD